MSNDEDKQEDANQTENADYEVERPLKRLRRGAELEGIHEEESATESTDTGSRETSNEGEGVSAKQEEIPERTGISADMDSEIDDRGGKDIDMEEADDDRPQTKNPYVADEASVEGHEDEEEEIGAEEVEWSGEVEESAKAEEAEGDSEAKENEEERDGDGKPYVEQGKDSETLEFAPEAQKDITQKEGGPHAGETEQIENENENVREEIDEQAEEGAPPLEVNEPQGEATTSGQEETEKSQIVPESTPELQPEEAQDNRAAGVQVNPENIQRSFNLLPSATVVGLAISAPK